MLVSRHGHGPKRQLPQQADPALLLVLLLFQPTNRATISCRQRQQNIQRLLCSSKNSDQIEHTNRQTSATFGASRRQEHPASRPIPTRYPADSASALRSPHSLPVSDAASSSPSTPTTPRIPPSVASARVFEHYPRPIILFFYSTSPSLPYRSRPGTTSGQLQPERYTPRVLRGRAPERTR